MAGMLIKCSTCGLDIDIDRMADHLCGPGLGSKVDRQPPRSFNDAFSNMSVNQSAPAPFRSKPIPRPIDSTAANEPFLGRPSGPVGFESRISDRRIPFTPRSATFPRPPSKDVVLPQECAFPPFPLAGRSPAKSLHRANTDPIDSSKSATFSSEASNSYNTSNTASTPKSSFPTPQQPSIPILQQEPRIPILTNPSSISAAYAGTITLPEIPSSPARPRHMRNKSSVAAANRPLDEIGSIRTYKSRPETSVASSNYNQPRSASAQGHRYGKSFHDDAPPLPGAGNEIPRSASATGNRAPNPYTSGFDTPPIPSSLHHLRSDSQNTTGHTPSESTSSNQSDNSTPATSSSQSSPPSSPPRKAQHIHNQPARGLGIESERIVERPRTKSFSRPSYSRPTIPILSPDTLKQLTSGPWAAPSKENSPHSAGVLSPDSVAQFSAGPWAAPSKKDSTTLDLQINHTRQASRENTFPPTPESPMDPALKGNRLPFLKVQCLPPTTPNFTEQTRSAIMPSTRAQDIFPDPQNLKALGSAPLRRAQTVSKGKCRGCHETITGKSVSSADGRLTGRWHKQCFTCKTCAEPFPSMDFYVIGNDPYCARHYHRLNKSLCASCDRGIEGQYVDNEERKFHPHCFTCSKCHLILRDTYFDLNGKIYCDTHAFGLDRLPPYGGSGIRYPEKRSTRLMMI